MPLAVANSWDVSLAITAAPGPGDDDEDDEDKGTGSGGGGNIDPDDDDYGSDDDEDDDDEDPLWAVSWVAIAPVRCAAASWYNASRAAICEVLTVARCA